jgi:tetratricopeptide (TPR) repeat protein
LKSDIYVTLYHPRTRKSREVATDSRGFVRLEGIPSGLYVLREMTYVAESLEGSTDLSAPLTPMSCLVEPGTVTYCGTVVYTFQRLPQGAETYTGRIRPLRPGLQGLDILDESAEARKLAPSGLAFKTSLWIGPTGLPKWEAAVRFHQGLEHAKVRQYDKAIPEFLAGLEIDPAHPWAHYMLARAYYWLGRDEEARAQYGEALSLEPRFVWAHHGLGILYLLEANYPRAREEFQKAAALDPSFVPVAYYHLKMLERIAKVGGTPLDEYKPRSKAEESIFRQAREAIQGLLAMDWKKTFAYFDQGARIEAHCSFCEPSKFFSLEELREYIEQPMAQNYRIHHIQVRILDVSVEGSEARVTFFSSYELSKTNEEKGWWFADVSEVRARRASGTWVLTEHRYLEHLH